MNKETILKFFAKQTGLSELKLANATISSTAVTRPHLITMVEYLQEKTGVIILNESDAPMRHLPEAMTYSELAQALSTPNLL